MKKIGFIGTGVMGSYMAGHLIDAGYDVTLYSRTREKAEETGKRYGGKVAGSVREASEGKDIIITMVGYPRDVEEVYFGEGGIIDSADEGTYLIDMTTSSPDLAVRISGAAKKKQLQAIDAPVSGGDTGARLGTLSIMAGGDRKDIEDMKPVFEILGKSINYIGPAGSGQHTKAANQIIVAGNTAAYTEALIYAEKAGIDPDLMLKAISGGAAGSWQIDNMAPRVRKGDFEPGFFIKHFIKDMKIAKEEMEKNGKELKVLNEVLSMYEKLSEEGYENLGTQALIKYYSEK